MRILILAAIGGAVVAAGTAAGRLQAATIAETSIGDRGALLFRGQATFPIALSNPPPLDGLTPAGANGLDEVVKAGVTFFRVGPPTTPWTLQAVATAEQWDRAALERGVHTWVGLGNATTATPGSHSDDVLRMVVGALTSDPTSAAGLGMWKGADEPGWHGPPPSALQFAFCRVTSRGQADWCAGEQPLDPGHVWVTIQAPRGTAAQLAGYSSVTDTNGVDVYPVTLGSRDPDLHRVGTWTKAIASITPSGSVWTTLQICASSSFDPATGRYVLPTRLQERYMVYDAIVNGARGLAFFGGDVPGCWNASDRALGWNWTFWNRTLAPLVGEIGARSPIAAALANPVSTRVLATSDPSTEAISRVARTPTGTQLWVLVARSGPGTKRVAIRGLPPTATWASVYKEPRAVPVTKGTITDDFGRWQVHVYHFPLHPAVP